MSYIQAAIEIKNLVTTIIQGNELTYFLYKCYHRLMDKGMVFYQTVNKETFEPIGEFSKLKIP